MDLPLRSNSERPAETWPGLPGCRHARPGPVRRYAYPPNRLGLCGPADAPSLRDGRAAGADRELRELARGFEGAYPYLSLIAQENGIADPLDRRVVEAYWLGGAERSNRPRSLHRNVDRRFRGRMTVATGAGSELAVSGIPSGARLPRAGDLSAGRPHARRRLRSWKRSTRAASGGEPWYRLSRARWSLQRHAW